MMYPTLIRESSLIAFIKEDNGDRTNEFFEIDFDPGQSRSDQAATRRGLARRWSIAYQLGQINRKTRNGEIPHWRVKNLSETVEAACYCPAR
jgi:hypothetical protein